MSNLKYEEHLTTDRANKLMFAEQMTGHPGVVLASNRYTETAKSIGTNFIAYDATTPMPTMLWQGTRMELEDIHDSIQDTKGISPEDKGKLEIFVSTLMGINADGAGLSTVLETLKADVDSSGRSRMLVLLNKINPGLTRSLTGALSQYKRIEKVANYAGGFYNAPVDVTERSDFREYIQGSGLSQKLQEYRTMEAEGKDSEELGKEIDSIISGVKLQIKKSGDKKMLKDFFNWMELEDATAELYKESAIRRRK